MATLSNNSGKIAILLILSGLLLFLPGCGTVHFNQKTAPSPAYSSESILDIEVDKHKETVNNLNDANDEIESSNVKSKIPTTVSTIKYELKKAEQSVDNLKKAQKETRNLNNNLSKIQGKPIEGTGFEFSLFSPVVIICIILLILFPSLIPVFLMIISRLKSALSATVNGIENHLQKTENEDLKYELSRAMDKKHKHMVSKLKQKTK